MNLKEKLDGLNLETVIKEINQEIKGQKSVFLSNESDVLDNIPEDTVGIVLVRFKEKESSKTDKPLDKAVLRGSNVVILKAYNNHYLEQDLKAKLFKDETQGFGLAVIPAQAIAVKATEPETNEVMEDILIPEIAKKKKLKSLSVEAIQDDINNSSENNEVIEPPFNPYNV